MLGPVGLRRGTELHRVGAVGDVLAGARRRAGGGVRWGLLGGLLALGGCLSQDAVRSELLEESGEGERVREVGKLLSLLDVVALLAAEEATEPV
ncbi:MAG: hypothetical protein AMXMBFR64_45530 [Myxococcales bacterium]